MLGYKLASCTYSLPLFRIGLLRGNVAKWQLMGTQRSIGSLFLSSAAGGDCALPLLVDPLDGGPSHAHQRR